MFSEIHRNCNIGCHRCVNLQRSGVYYQSAIVVMYHTLKNISEIERTIRVLAFR